MKLALLRREYRRSGGAELYVQRLLTALAGAGHEIHLLCEHWEGVPARVRCERLTVKGAKSDGLGQFATAARRVLAHQHFDCVLSFERGVPTDVYRAGDGVHSVWISHWRRWGRWWKRPLAGKGALQAALRAADARSFNPANTGRIIVNSEMVRSEIRAHYPAFPDDRIHCVRNGVDVADLRAGDRERGRQRLGLARDVSLVLFAGSGWERKGLAWLLRAWPHLEPGRFALAVAGRGRRPLRVPPGVHFLGAVPPADLRDLYAAADVFVLPTLYDPCANVCLEALTAGLPVITTRQNGAAELMRDGVNGTVLPSPDATGAMVEAIRTWTARREPVGLLPGEDVSMERNLRETLAVMEVAAAVKASRTPASPAAGD